ncbi:50S ribosomal protein L25/general stress protein Ctc [Acetobacteroides hydrogenigenes]|uniref:Large ribosomal subunit protein bL25 n=1 Tax=Acetobacteroides hydrogenigenes TaxID=979970 RepID=A0A4R2EYF4_9BACT|nr:50S ribosomal protein L25/general stress protein Ctc [Acetobacteroides hydrogenigenes]TCN72957.1 large subunit ribosomal protein L25 [Acetobacteroides hydrogenigenes]
MQNIELKGALRSDLGKKGAKDIRRSELTPCNLYGNGGNVNFTVVEKDLKDILYTPNAYIIDLNIDGKSEKAVIREVQFHPVTDEVLHIDFYRVTEDKPVVIEVPVKLNGSSDGVKQGGKLQLSSRKLKVSALIKDLPDTLDIDITTLGLGKTIMVGELEFPNVTILNPKSTVVCAVKMTRAARGAAAAAALAAQQAGKKKK